MRLHIKYIGYPEGYVDVYLAFPRANGFVDMTLGINSSIIIF